MFPDSLIEFVQNHQILAVAIIVVLGVSVYLKPKPTFQLLGAILVIGAIGYVVSFLVDLTSTGIEETQSLMGRPEK